MDLTQIQDDIVRVQVLDKLHKHASFCNGTLGTYQATKHRIDLEPGTQPVDSVP